MPFKRESTIIFEDEEYNENAQGTVNIQQKQNQSANQSKYNDRSSQHNQNKKIKQVEDASYLSVEHVNENFKQSFSGLMAINSKGQSSSLHFGKPSTELQQNQDNSSKKIKSVECLLSGQIDAENKNSIHSKQVSSAIPKPSNLQKVSLFMKTWKFYSNISQNIRIFSKITQHHHDTINDKSSYFDNLMALHQKSQLTHKLLFNSIMSVFTHLLNQLPTITVFMRSHFLIRFWEICQAISIIITQFAYSLIVFFEESPEEFHYIFLACFLVLALGILFQFNIASMKKGHIITSRKYIAKKYIKSNLFVDIIGLTPLVFEIFRISINTAQFRWVIYILVLFLNCKLKSIIENITFYLSFEKNLKNKVDLAKLIFVIVTVCHIFCMLWHGLGLIEVENGIQKTWLKEQNLVQEESTFKRYIYSFYFLAVTMITVGYGDITPQNEYEVSFTIFTMFVTGFFYAYSLNKIGRIMDNINRKDKVYNQQMQIIHGYLRTENVSTILRGKISSYLKYLYKESNEVQRKQEKIILEKLSKQLKIDLIQEVTGKYLKNIPFLREFQSQNKIIELMEECLYSPGEKIYTQGEFDDCSLYFIVKGEVQIVFQGETHNSDSFISSLVKKYSKGSFFGEYCFLTKQQRESSAIANDFCRLYRIQQEKFINLIKENDNDYEIFCMIRDQVVVNQNYQNSSIRCYTCEKNNHQFVFCPKTHYIRSKQALIAQYNYPVINEERDKFTRRKKKVNNPLNQQQNYLSAAYLINKEYGFSGMLNEISSVIYSDLNILEYDQNRYQIDAQEMNEDVYKNSSSKGSNSNLPVYLSQISRNIYPPFRQASKAEQLNSDFHQNDQVFLNKIDEDSSDQRDNTNNYEETIGTKKLNSTAHFTSYERVPTKLRLKQQQTLPQQSMMGSNEKSFQKQNSNKSFYKLDSYNNHEGNKKKSQSKQEQFQKQKWNTDNLDKYRFQDEHSRHDVDSQNAKVDSPRFQSPISKKIDLKRNHQKPEHSKSLMRYLTQQQSIVNEDSPYAGDAMSNQHSILNLSPTSLNKQYPQMHHNQHNRDDLSNFSKVNTPDNIIENGQQLVQSNPSEVSVAKQYFNNVKKTFVQKQMQLHTHPSLKGVSSLQSNVDSSLDIMKKQMSESNRNSFLYLPNVNQPNMMQPYFVSDQMSQRNDMSTNSPKTKGSKIQSEQYQVVVNSEQNLTTNEQSMNQQIHQFLLPTKEQEESQENIKWIQYMQQQKNNIIFDYSFSFDFAKIFKKYFPKYNYDRVLLYFKKKQLSLRNEQRKSIKKVSMSSFKAQEQARKSVVTKSKPSLFNNISFNENG